MKFDSRIVPPGLVAGALLMLGGCAGPPQMGLDREVFTTVDALYTAVGIKDLKQVERCDKTFRELHGAGKLPESAFRSLESIISRARDGSWESAASDLRWFMKGQKR